MASVEDEVNSSAATESKETPSGESKTQREARLRRERRNAKLQAGGSERLSKIMASSGRTVAAEEELSKVSTRPTPSPSPSQRAASTRATEDPAEVDISKVFQNPSAAEDLAMQDPQALFRQMLAATGTSEDQGSSPHAGPDADDPMLRMMQQMLGGASSPGAGADGLSPGLAAMFGGGQPQPETPQSSSDYLWRVVHAVLSLLLGVYATAIFSFNGSELERTTDVSDNIGPRLFWIFATAELVLQSTRYFIDGGKLPASGLLGGLGQMLPEPYANYVRVVSRYSIIYTTITSDAMVVVFVLGCMAWWKGFGGA